MEEYFQAPGVPVGLTDRNKVRLALFKMEGEALDWRNTMLRQFTTEGRVWPTWNAFRTYFLGKWGESNETAKAMRQLMNYTWKTAKGDDIPTRITKLSTLLQLARITNDEQKRSFLRKILPFHHCNFLAMVRPTTYNDSVTAILEYEVELGRNELANHAPAVHITHHDPNAMDTSAGRVAINFNQMKKPSGDQKCFKCGRTGHFAKDCYAKTSVAGSSSSSSSKSFKSFKPSGNRPSFGNKQWNNKGKGKGKPPFKKKWIRGVEVEGNEEEEQDEETASIRYLDQMRETVGQMDDDMRRELLVALQQDFQ